MGDVSVARKLSGMARGVVGGRTRELALADEERIKSRSKKKYDLCSIGSKI